MTGLHVWIDGQLVDPDDARVSVYDVGFRGGEGVFETLRVYGTHPFRLEPHVARAVAGAATVGFALDPEVLHRAVRATISANTAYFDGEDHALRLTASAGRLDPFSAFPGTRIDEPMVVVTSHPLRLASDGVRAVTVAAVRDLPQVKATSYLTAITARRQAIEQAADEALLTTADGNILEGTSTNVFAVVAGTLVTPPVRDGLLAGVTRAVILELATAHNLPHEVRSLHVDELLAAEEAFVTASVRGIVPLVQVDGQPIGALTSPGSITARLIDAYHDAVRHEQHTGG